MLSLFLPAGCVHLSANIGVKGQYSPSLLPYMIKIAYEQYCILLIIIAYFNIWHRSSR